MKYQDRNDCNELLRFSNSQTVESQILYDRNFIFAFAIKAIRVEFSLLFIIYFLYLYLYGPIIS